MVVEFSSYWFCSFCSHRRIQVNLFFNNKMPIWRGCGTFFQWEFISYIMMMMIHGHFIAKPNRGGDAPTFVHFLQSNWHFACFKQNVYYWHQCWRKELGEAVVRGGPYWKLLCIWRSARSEVSNFALFYWHNIMTTFFRELSIQYPILNHSKTYKLLKFTDNMKTFWLIVKKFAAFLSK